MEISAKLVKELREKTSCSLGECKKALNETNGDLQAAIKYLKEKGLADASKKSGRATKEGLVVSVIAPDATAGILMEVNCETDFVARNDDFVAKVTELAKTVYEDTSITDPASLESKKSQALKELIATMGENMTFGQFYRVKGDSNTYVADYIHAGGKIGVLGSFKVGNSETTKKESFQSMTKNVCMQIAALAPVAVNPEGIDSAIIAEQEEIFKTQLKESGKPEKMWDNIIKGKMNKFFSEVTLVHQQYVKEPERKITVGDYIKEVANDMDDTIQLETMCRIQLGESE